VAAKKSEGRRKEGVPPPPPPTTAAETIVQRKAEQTKTTVSPEAWLDRDSKMSISIPSKYSNE